MTSWNWTPSETARRRCSHYERHRRFFNFVVGYVPSFSTCCATRRMMCMGGCRSMCAAYRRVRQHRSDPKAGKLVATIRSREISACLVLQAQSQLKPSTRTSRHHHRKYGLYALPGRQGADHLKGTGEILGKRQSTYNTSESRSGKLHSSTIRSRKELMSQDELAVMDGGKCILAAARREAFFGQVRYYQASKIQNTVRLRQEKRL